MMGRSLSIIKGSSAFLAALSTRQVLQALGLSHLDYCSVMWLGATKREKEVSSVSKFRTDYGRHTVLHKAMTTWNSVTDSTSSN